MIIEAIISSRAGEHLAKGDLYEMMNAVRDEDKCNPRFEASLVNNQATQIHKGITSLSQVRGRDVRGGKNLYFSVKTNYAQEFYHALSKFGFNLVDSKISVGEEKW